MFYYCRYKSIRSTYPLLKIPCMVLSEFSVLLTYFDFNNKNIYTWGLATVHEFKYGIRTNPTDVRSLHQNYDIEYPYEPYIVTFLYFWGHYSRVDGFNDNHCKIIENSPLWHPPANENWHVMSRESIGGWHLCVLTVLSCKWIQ